MEKSKKTSPYALSGRITDSEGQPVGGISVHAFDQDPRTPENALGQVVNTDHDGYYRIIFTDKDFKIDGQESGGPDVFIRVFTGEKLLAESPVFRNSKKRIVIDLQVESDSPLTALDEVQCGLKIRAKHLEIKNINGYSEPRLPGFANFGNPGEVSLPTQAQYVVLPKGGTILDIDIEPGQPIVFRDIENPMPYQNPVPDLGVNPKEYGDGITFHDTKIKFTRLHREQFSHGTVIPQKLVELKEIIYKDTIHIARFIVSPVQYSASEKAYYFYPDLKYNVRFDKKNADILFRNEKRKWGVSEVELLNDFMDLELVFKPGDFRISERLRFFEQAAHIIITDNYTWPEHIVQSDGTLRPPTAQEKGAALTGDLVAEFQRLAVWKTSKGIKSKVVTVSDIVAGRYGDFTKNGFARDLQEVLRNFLKFAYNSWQTRYVLLGGDYNVVPVRRLTGSSLYGTVGTARDAVNPPAEGTCHVLTSRQVVKIRPGFVPQPEDPLSTYHTGLRIPFNREAGTGYLGWYYTSEAHFNSRDEGFARLPIGQTSNYIIVEGPGAVIDDDYYWLREVNAIPSDLYYSSLLGAGYNLPGKHDFDLNNNGLYGQFHWLAGEDASLDGVDNYPDIFPGRASVENAAEAKAFVDKTITYERRTNPDGSYVPSNYFKKIIYSADLWGGFGRNSLQADTSVPPAEGQFLQDAASSRARIHLNFDVTLPGGNPSHRLIARSGNTDTILPYSSAASATVPGWYFATSNTFTTSSSSATRFVVVRGANAQINPNEFVWDEVTMEGAIAEKEALRSLMSTWFPEFNEVQRHYTDYFDVSQPPSLKNLNADVLRDAMDEGVHFVSLTGHGWSGGCAGLDTYSRPDFKNKNKYFIAFADSCSTAHFDGPDSTAEITTNHAEGGAVAYIGNTRYGWIGIGHHFEKFFWNKLSSCKRPGVAAGLRQASGGPQVMWTIYAQTLFGDPETQVYTKVPPQYVVVYPETVRWGEVFKVKLIDRFKARGNHLVTLSAGWDETSQQALIQIAAFAGPDGTVELKLPDTLIEHVDELKLTVTGRNYEPHIKMVSISR